MIDFKIVDIKDVPPFKYRRPRTDWRKIFEDIPNGKAVIIEGDKSLTSNISNALTRYQKKGLFENYFVTRRIDKIYLVNPSGAEID